MLLSEFLECKPLYYSEIDYTRMPRVYETIKNHFHRAKVIHLIGTNGKGTTGRFLASALQSVGKSVGHYTSPHIVSFNERIWINGNDISTELLEKSHQRLQSLLANEDRDSLSYFEYTTFLAMLSFNECEYIVLEAGLGGVHDATAVFEKILTLVTPISYDHQDFLGSSIQSIASEKLNAVQNNAIIAYQNHAEVYEVARRIEKENKSIVIKNIDTCISDLDKKDIENISNQLELAKYLEKNLTLSIAALNFLGIEYNLDSFRTNTLFGRLSKLNDNIIVDVGHNPLAAQAIVESLHGEKYILIYNSYANKEYKKILKILKPILIHVEIIHVEDDRIEEKQKIQKVLTDLKINCYSYKAIEQDKKYLVFGSFKVVENFLKGYNE